ncbi:hypothetical protein HZS_7372, partial [Henneguya salminicola]
MNKKICSSSWHSPLLLILIFSQVNCGSINNNDEINYIRVSDGLSNFMNDKQSIALRLTTEEKNQMDNFIIDELYILWGTICNNRSTDTINFFSNRFFNKINDDYSNLMGKVESIKNYLKYRTSPLVAKASFSISEDILILLLNPTTCIIDENKIYAFRRNVSLEYFNHLEMKNQSKLTLAWEISNLIYSNIDNIAVSKYLKDKKNEIEIAFIKSFSENPTSELAVFKKVLKELSPHTNKTVTEKTFIKCYVTILMQEKSSAYNMTLADIFNIHQKISDMRKDIKNRMNILSDEIRSLSDQIKNISNSKNFSLDQIVSIMEEEALILEKIKALNDEIKAMTAIPETKNPATNAIINKILALLNHFISISKKVMTVKYRTRAVFKKMEIVLKKKINIFKDIIPGKKEMSAISDKIRSIAQSHFAIS